MSIRYQEPTPGSAQDVRTHSSIILIAFGLAAGLVRADVISYLRFEEGSGVVAYDQTGLLNGELSDFSRPTVGWSVDVFSPIVPQTGQPNTGSLRFGGGSEFVDLSNPSTLMLGTAFTVEFFMKPEQPTISAAFGFAPLSALYLSLYIEGTGELYFNSQFMSSIVYGPATGVRTGVWQHVALVKQPGEYSIYLDGTRIIHDGLPGSTDGPYIFPGGITGDRSIGGESGTWRGWMDEFRISDEALTPDQFLIAPEPGTIGLLGIGGLALLLRRRALAVSRKGCP